MTDAPEMPERPDRILVFEGCGPMTDSWCRVGGHGAEKKRPEEVLHGEYVLASLADARVAEAEKRAVAAIERLTDIASILPFNELLDVNRDDGRGNVEFRAVQALVVKLDALEKRAEAAGARVRELGAAVLLAIATECEGEAQACESHERAMKSVSTRVPVSRMHKSAAMVARTCEDRCTRAIQAILAVDKAITTLAAEAGTPKPSANPSHGAILYAQGGRIFRRNTDGSVVPVSVEDSAPPTAEAGKEKCPTCRCRIVPGTECRCCAGNVGDIPTMFDEPGVPPMARANPLIEAIRCQSADEAAMFAALVEEDAKNPVVDWTAEQERAAVVAWLRERGVVASDKSIASLSDIADDIESGAHLPKEGT